MKDLLNVLFIRNNSSVNYYNKHISNFVLSILLYTSLIIFLQSEVDGKKFSNPSSEKRDNHSNTKGIDKIKDTVIETKEDEVIDDTPLEKDPHFLVWKILTKLLLLTILRATKRFWSPHFNILGQGYRYYLMATLMMWLHICLDVIMEAISSSEQPTVNDPRFQL